jgi:hypothetical protein
MKVSSLNYFLPDFFLSAGRFPAASVKLTAILLSSDSAIILSLPFLDRANFRCSETRIS